MKAKVHTKHWFMNRIGKKIYRCDTMDCGCLDCVSARNGIKLKDKLLANYLISCQDIIGYRYSDKKGIIK